MINADQYIHAVAGRVGSSGGDVFGAPVGPVHAMVGRVRDKLPLLMGTMHFCVVAASIETVNGFVVTDFTHRATAFAKAHTEGVIGFGASLFTAGIVATRVEPDAVAAATAKPDVDFGASSRPVVVDLTTGAIHMFTGTPAWGFAVQGMIRDKARQFFPTPAEVAGSLAGPPAPPPPGPPPPGPPPSAPGYGAPRY